ncbi:glucose PTS transporter subunit IIA, partial [uncultured Sphingomonas sp.]|uniref:glucose PTS transporter subunit IIA n=1 Tax=uncultured Sphingomonas sp. TaxID=158754 RepID=UPI002628C3C1
MATIPLFAPLEGWAGPVQDVPDAVFAEAMLGDGIAIDPVAGMLVAPCDAQVVTVQPTGHAITLVTPEGAELLIHIGLDTVALAGRGFEPVVKAGDRVACGAALIRFDLDMVVREARAVVTPIVVTNGERFAIEHRAGAGMVAVGDPLMTLVARADVATATTAEGGASASRTIAVPLVHGIHARPAARIAELAKRFAAEVMLEKDAISSSARSPIGLLTLGVGHGDTVTITATGADAEAAVAAVAELILSGIHE